MCILTDNLFFPEHSLLSGFFVLGTKQSQIPDL